MTLAEIAKKFPLGSYVLGTSEGCYPHKMGIVLGHREAVPNKACMRVAWIEGLYSTFERQSVGTFPEEVEPYGEIDAIRALVEFADGCLDSVSLGRPDREKLENAIAILEEVYGI